MVATSVATLPWLLGAQGGETPNDALTSLTHRADAAFVGRLVRSEVGVSRGSWFVTFYAFEDVDWLKGGDDRSSYVVAVEGGTIGDTTVQIAGVPRLEPGNDYLLFLSRNGSTPLPFVDGVCGMLELEPVAGAAVADGNGSVWLENIHGEAHRRRMPGGVGASRLLLDRVADFRTLIPAEDLLERVRDAALDSPSQPVRTLSVGDFDAYKPG